MKTILTVCYGVALGLLAGCSTIKELSNETTLYKYRNGFVTDRDNKIVAHYANGFVTKYSDISREKHIQINSDLELFRLTPGCFLYTAWADMGRWGRIGSNGLVIVKNGKALLIDTPVHESQTVELAWWLDKNLDAKLELFVPGHWHDDCTGGLAWLNRNHVKTYANIQTNQILTAKGMEPAQESFSDSLTLKVGNIHVKLYYMGGGHSTDNIVAWIPSEKILFGGCMIKDMNATSIGNTADAAPLTEWLETINRIEDKFPDAKIIVPGHGEHGGRELFNHTKQIIQTVISHSRSSYHSSPAPLLQHIDNS